MKYPEFKDAYKDATWYGGHLCKKNGLYYKLVKKADKMKEVVSFTYEELSDKDKTLVQQVTEERANAAAELTDYFHNVLPAKQKLIDYVRTNGILNERSKVSESEYWRIKATDGTFYKVRISGHRYPTGSMTNLNLNVIDTTDDDCRQYCKIFGI